MLNKFNRSMMMNAVASEVGEVCGGKLDKTTDPKLIVESAIKALRDQAPRLAALEMIGAAMPDTSKKMTDALINLQDNREEAVEFLNQLFALCEENPVNA